MAVGSNVLSLFLRRLRMPLLVLIVAYAISILGMVLVPGVDGHGRPWRMDFFHAFYFVSFMGSTIGFGEIPYAFSEAQRLWTVVSIYLTVFAWLFAIGSLLAAIQDPVLRGAFAANQVRRSVRRLNERFYLVCGYGETGSMLVEALTRLGIQSVVLDINPERIRWHQLRGHPISIPAVTADARNVERLVQAGLCHPLCAGVVALTNVDHTNLKVAMTSKLLNPALPAICRSETRAEAANMRSFDTDHVIDPFRDFADHLALALHSPSLYLLHDWLTSVPGTSLSTPLRPPRGTWILCGYGRFGKALQRYFDYEGIHTVIVEEAPERAGTPPGAVVGRGTEAVTLREAGIMEAAGIVAGTDDDANNLSIIVTARDLNPAIFTVARQNRRNNDALFQAADIDLVMQRRQIMVHRILAHITAPLLAEFLRLARHQREDWAARLAMGIRALTGDLTPAIWTVVMREAQAPAVSAALREGRAVDLADLQRHPRNRSAALACRPLLLHRGGENLLLPPNRTPLQSGDRILFCGTAQAEHDMEWTLNNNNILRYVQSGEELPGGWLWRWLAARRSD